MPHWARDIAEPLQQRLAHHRDLRRVRRRCRQRQAVGADARANGVGARHRGDPGRRACANASARRPKASASAMPRATACGRRCWRQRDFAGPAEPLNGRQGYYHALGEAPNLSALTDGLGESWEIMPTSYKPYPCGFVLHPVIDCVLGWRRENPRRAGREGRGDRQSADGGPRRPAEYFHRPRIPGQRAARRRRRIDLRQGRPRTVHRRLRQRSGGAGAARQGRGVAR